MSDLVDGPSYIRGVRSGREHGAADERQAVVAWLRKQQAGCEPGGCEWRELRDAIDAIERGDHRGKP